MMPFRRSTWRMVLMLVTIAMLAVPAVASAGGPSDLLPDLRSKKLEDFRIQNTVLDGKKVKLLRFSSTILNLGAGPFQVSGSRPCAGAGCPAAMTTVQQIKQTDGSWRQAPSNAKMKYDVGDGHNHWHIMRIQRFELIPTSVQASTPPTRRGSKIGFCFFDTNAQNLKLPGAAKSRVYNGTTCGVRNSTKASMGLSVGWGDKYGWNLAHQWINVTGLPVGKYIVCATVDPQGFYQESHPNNNQSWAEIRLKANGKVGVLRSKRGSCDAQLPAAAKTATAVQARATYTEPVAVYGTVAAADFACSFLDRNNPGWKAARLAAAVGEVLPADDESALVQ